MTQLLLNDKLVRFTTISLFFFVNQSLNGLLLWHAKCWPNPENFDLILFNMAEIGTFSAQIFMDSYNIHKSKSRPLEWATSGKFDDLCN